MKTERLVFTEEEKARRRELNLPVTKQLRYMKHLSNGNWEEILVDNYDYEIVDTYLPSGTRSLMVTLETGEKVRILHPFFVHMQAASFVEDMQKLPEDE